MTQAAYHADSYKTELETTVLAADENGVVLADTIFYPIGGGQPGDTGNFSTVDGNQYAVVNTVRDRDSGNIVHQLKDHNLQAGQTVTVAIDWSRRYRHMRMHTAMHLLGSLIHVPVTGGQVGAQKSRLDFDVGELQLDKEVLTDQINQLIEQGHAIEISAITDAELDANPDLVRTMSVQPPRGAGTIRMIRVQDVDYQPCGGTHVRNTAEIGKVRISKIQNKGKHNRRVHLVFEE